MIFASLGLRTTQKFLIAEKGVDWNEVGVFESGSSDSEVTYVEPTESNGS